MGLELSVETFDRFRWLIQRHAGITLGEAKLSFLRSRLSQRLIASSCASFEKYYERITREQDTQELQFFLHAVTTHHTFFFREAAHFELLAHQIESWINAGRSRLRIWSAACSTGEEPLSLLMTLCDRIGTDCLQDVDLRILATDLSVPVVAKARTFAYSKIQFRNIPSEKLHRYFEHLEGDSMRLRQEYTGFVKFNRLNLLEPRYPMKGRFDAIFCRNVLIYFDGDSRQKVLAQLSNVLNEDGYLFVGMTESALQSGLDLKFVEPAVYQRSGSGVSIR